MFSSKKWPLTCKRCGKKVRSVIFLPPNADIVCLDCVPAFDVYSSSSLLQGNNDLSSLSVLTAGRSRLTSKNIGGENGNGSPN